MLKNLAKQLNLYMTLPLNFKKVGDPQESLSGGSVL